MNNSATLPQEIQNALDRVVGALAKTLGENLHSLVLYGSAVRGNHLPTSDLNLLILLEESTPAAHAAIAEAIQGDVRVEPFILSRALLARSVQAFAVKFLSIRRNYQVLRGADPFSGLAVDESLARFLCEQQVRNLRLRCVRAFVVFGRNRNRYSAFLAKIVSALFTDLGEALRRVGLDVPRTYEERIPLLEKTLGADASILRKLLELKSSMRTLSADEIQEFHAGLFTLLESSVRWMEAQWPPLR